MNAAPLLRAALAAACLLSLLPPPLTGQTTGKSIPEALRPWQDWATWNDDTRFCPTPYNDASRRLCVWPGRLRLEAGREGGRFDFEATLFRQTWLMLPGSRELWPTEVRVNNAAVPVLEKDGRPAVQLPAGSHRLSGTYRWDEIPQRIPVPRDIGILSLVVEGRPVESPAWDAENQVWLKRTQSEAADKDFLATKVYRLIEDGIPMWLRTEVELSVAGKSREESLGAILPEGWQLAEVDSPLPVAVDPDGRLKTQVRAGKWTIRLSAFRLNHAATFQFAPGLTPAQDQELVAFRALPEFRMVELTGLPLVDVSQTTFPAAWRELPVYSWTTATPFQIEERMRGMGGLKPHGIQISRTLWLDEDGRGLTFRDNILGAMQQIWRLDAAPGQELGSVTSGGQGQLITRNPETGASGVEIRQRSLQLQATGRMPRGTTLDASGWQADAEGVNVVLHLPPGWRLFALTGADTVDGDWLTAWTLLDLFLLLVFSLAIYRLWGLPAGLLAFAAFALAYHEPGAPRYAWLFLLAPAALLRALPKGRATLPLQIWKWIAALALVALLIPFVYRQIQQTIYPQLENQWQSSSLTGAAASEMIYDMAAREEQALKPEAENQVHRPLHQSAQSEDSYSWSKSRKLKENNLAYDTKARIQTGPGVPEWTWRTVSFGWNGPVQSGQKVRPYLISQTLERILSLTRVALLLALAAVLLEARRLTPVLRRWRGPGAAAALLVLSLLPGSASAQMPDAAMLETLRQRLLETSDAYPHAADIPRASLTLDGDRLTLDAEIHTALRTAVPLPGRLPAWSPVRVTVNGRPEAALRRDNGYLWVALPAGVHQVRVEGLLPGVTEWEWSFLLPPRQVRIQAPGWTTTGVRPNGVPEGQVFFARQQKTSGGEAAYDRPETRSIAALDRQVELGLVWQVANSITRLSPKGKALSLRIPLLPGEKVLSSTVQTKDGFIEVRLGAFDTTFRWESELTPSDRLTLATRPDDSWVERWHLTASPVWNVAFEGLAPVFESGQTDLIPVWRPWPGEEVRWSISRPEAVSGATVTIHRAHHETALGRRQRTSTLNLDLQSSLGEDFALGLPEGAGITSLRLQEKDLPVRMDGGRVLVPLRPGRQNLSVQWTTSAPLGWHAAADTVTLPVEAANASTILQVPEDRWVLWTHGPQRGPAVRFWSLLAVSLLAAAVLARLPGSPVGLAAWLLLLLGLTQVHPLTALVAVGWFFAFAYRGHPRFLTAPAWARNLGQAGLAGWTLVFLGILIGAVSAGLLGRPEMFILGNNSSATSLNWYQARTGTTLPEAGCVTVSIWFYRLLMLAWALWLALALLRWLKWAWLQFSLGGAWHSGSAAPTPPPLGKA